MRTSAYQVTRRPASTGAAFFASGWSAVGTFTAARTAASATAGCPWSMGAEAIKPAIGMLVDVPNHRTRRPWEASQ